MSYENDFVKDEIIDLNIEGYPKGSWKYKPTTAGDENEWLDEYMIFDKETKTMKQNYSKLNKLKLSNVVGVPYSDEELIKITGLNKSWNDRNVNEKWLLFGKLKSSVFDKVLNAINQYDVLGKEAKND